MRALLLASMTAALLAVPAQSGAWPTLLPETPDTGRPFAVAADGAGDVLVVGRTLTARGDDDGIIAKLAGFDGAIVWQHAITGSAAPKPGDEEAITEVVRALAVAANDDAVAVGRVDNAETGADMLVTRRDALDGAPVWEIVVDGGAAAADDGHGVALDAAGDVLAAGALRPADPPARRPAVLKLAGATGEERWRVLLAGDGGIARAVSADADGAVVVAGDVGATWFVAKLAGDDGALLWRTDLPGETGNAVVRALALDTGGGVVVAGRSFGATSGQDFVIVALATDGGERWRYTLDGSVTGEADADEAFGVAVDPAGDVVAAGVVSHEATGDDLVVVKLDGMSGAELWRVEVDGTNSRDDDASGVAVDPAGDVAVVGALRNRGSGRDLVVLSLDRATGAERWRRTIDGTASQADVGFAVAVDGTEALLAAGRTRHGEGADSLTVLKLSHATGGDHPCGNGVLDPGEECDDANLALGDGCRPDCTAERCGDGVLDPQEECDDGNTVDGDCCSMHCTLEPDGAPCEDGNACTEGDTCTAGVCQAGAPVVCVPVNDCHDGVCDPATGLCTDVQRPNGRLCDDGDACTVADRCTDGECVAGPALSCDDFDPCTVDSCDPATGCAHEAITGFEGVACAFERERVATFCFQGLPRGIERRIARADRRVERAAESARLGRAKRLLKSAHNAAEQARKRAARRTARGDLSPPCGAVLADVLARVGERAVALRAELAAGR